MFINASEISRRVDKKRVHKEPHWAKPILMSMEERGILEADIQGRYRIKPVRRKKKDKWVAPDIAKIIEEHKITIPGHSAPGSAPSNVTAMTEGESDIADDEYYEQL
jgi:hypothetical protein